MLDAFAATSQATANVTVSNPGFSLAPTLPAVTTAAGGSATEHITFSPNPGIGGALTLACSNLPAKSACSFAPATLPAGSAQTDVVLTISTTRSTAVLAQPRVFYAAWLLLMGPGLMGMCVVAMPRKRRKASAMALTLLAVGVLALLVGCGGSSKAPVENGTPRGTYTVTVTGASGNATQTTTFSLTVH